MKTFKQFIQTIALNEGGGIPIFQRQQSTLVAHSIPKKEDREGKLASEPLPLQYKDDIHSALVSVGKIFHQHTGQHLFGDQDQSLNNYQSYAGSTRHVMKAPIEKVKKWFAIQGKKGDSANSVGDFDVHANADAIKAHGLDKMFDPTKPLGNGNVRMVGMIKAGTGHHILFRHTDPDGNDRHIQVDMMHTKYDGNAPNKDRAIGTGSEEEDLNKGIKGVSRQELASALVKVVGGEAKEKTFVSEKTGKPISVTDRDRHNYRLGSESNKVRPGYLPHSPETPNNVYPTKNEHVKSGQVSEQPLHEFLNDHFGTNYGHQHVASFMGLSGIAKKHMKPADYTKLTKMWHEKIIQQHPGEDGQGAEHVRNALNVLRGN